MISEALKNNILDMFEKAIGSQAVNDGDYYDDEGLLVCGVCGERRQDFWKLKSGDNEDQDETEDMEIIKIPRSCKCDRERKAEEERQKEQEKNAKIIEKLRKYSFIDGRLESATFETFIEDEYNSRNLKLCRRYALNFDKMVEKCQGLLMWGDVGTGKSFSAACIANYLLQQKVPVVMTSLIRLIDIIQNRSEDENTIIQKMQSAKLVIFDDFGAERGTEYVIEKLYSIIDSRYRSCLPMIITTNLTLEEMKTETDPKYRRIYDRLFECCYPMQFTGLSWRKKAASERYKEMSAFLESQLDEGGDTE